MTTVSARAAMKSDVRLVEKIGYFAANFGNIILSTVISSFLLIYLTDHVGINAAAVGTLLLVARLVDGATDPIMGYLVDHLPRTSWGRFRSYLLIGGAVGAVAFVALFLAPGFVGASLVAAWITYLIWGLAFDLMDIPLNALLPAMSASPRSRGQLAAIKGTTYLIGTLVVIGVSLPVVALLGGGALGWQVYVVIIAVVSFALTATGALLVRERVAPSTAEPYRFSDAKALFLSSRAVPVLLVSKLATSAANAALMAGIPFFFTYYAGSAGLVSAVALVMVVPMMLGSISGPLLGQRIGFKPVYLSSLVIAALGVGSILLLPGLQGPSYLVCFGVAGLGFGGAVALNYAMLAELTDFVELKGGFRTEGTLASIGSFAAKAGAGIGGALIAYVLAFSGYVAGAEQTPEALAGIALAQGGVPAALVVIGGLVFLAYPITRTVAAETRAALNERNDAR
ncbi:MFS transporter [Microbacterium saperdae]|uniref:GPH family glycoside/pentoside/hexuronide:cation symporter/glucuronide carrier protein n=1 Tax=Microbacterium saperdae TaxID=69368 RepID=A0A543BM04_9MICO|nr:glycoside-pentoside-hexuronide (GPH):cation symporter [Microbacterium saperdae]TQL85852.1 GPH family glycoside/pentoside/hexuronide:cation symporter/glucuronide carrier protein [Microbacterium saperdae]GGM52570.1 putative symporter YnaJ [Microbacterium saperdae]